MGEWAAAAAAGPDEGSARALARPRHPEVLAEPPAPTMKGRVGSASLARPTVLTFPSVIPKLCRQGLTGDSFQRLIVVLGRPAPQHFLELLLGAGVGNHIPPPFRGPEADSGMGGAR